MDLVVVSLSTSKYKTMDQVKHSMYRSTIRTQKNHGFVASPMEIENGMAGVGIEVGCCNYESDKEHKCASSFFCSET
jgi:hypothetical protein